MKFLNKLGGLLDSLNNAMAGLGILIIVFLMISVSAGVVMRYFVHQPLQWVLEISEYSLLYLTFVAAAWVLRKEGHVKIELVLDKLNQKARSVLNASTSIICSLVCLVLVWYGTRIAYEYVVMGRFEDTPLTIPTGYILAVIPFGSLLLAIQFVRRAYNYWLGRLNPPQETSGVD